MDGKSEKSVQWVHSHCDDVADASEDDASRLPMDGGGSSKNKWAMLGEERAKRGEDSEEEIERRREEETRGGEEKEEG